MSELADLCRGRWPEIIMRLGLLDSKALAGKHVPCPVCGGKDRFHFTDRGFGRWHCRGCGDGASGEGGGDGVKLVMRVKGIDFLKAKKLIEEIVGETRPKGSHKATAKPRRPASPQRAHAMPPIYQDNAAPKTTMADARDVWDRAKQLRGTPGEIYFSANRKLEINGYDHVLRWLPPQTGRVHAGQLSWAAAGGAVIALMQDILTGRARAAQLTLLDGEAQKIGRRNIGPVGGCVIMLDIFEDVTQGLHIGEGLETCMTGRLWGLVPVWALGSAGEIAKLPALGGVECLTLFQEVGCAASAAAVEACGCRWQAAGREVLIIEPTFGKDLNDVLKEKAAHPARKSGLVKDEHMGGDPSVKDGF
jgi:putative DNA primase/helicase